MWRMVSAADSACMRPKLSPAHGRASTAPGLMMACFAEKAGQALNR